MWECDNSLGDVVYLYAIALQRAAPMRPVRPFARRRVVRRTMPKLQVMVLSIRFSVCRQPGFEFTVTGGRTSPSQSF